MQVLVVGMHRSGTSMVARVLHALGLSKGEHSSTHGDIVSDENPHGFWEQPDVRAINEDLLRSVGCDWHLVLGFQKALPTEHLDQETVERMRRVIRGLDRDGPWMVKDPRLCLTLGHWQSVLTDPAYVFVLRHPLHVAASLRSRNDFPLDVGLALWEAYTRAALRLMPAKRTTVVHYEQLLAEPRAQIVALGERLRKLVPIKALADEAELAGLIDVGLNRSSKQPASEGWTEHPAIALHEQIVAMQSIVDPKQPLSAESTAALDRHQRAHRLMVYRVSQALTHQRTDRGAMDAPAEYPSALLPLARREAHRDEAEFYRSQCRQLDVSLTVWRSRLRVSLDELDSAQAGRKALAREAEEALDLLRAAQDMVRDVLGATPSHAALQLVPGAIGMGAYSQLARLVPKATRELVERQHRLQAESATQSKLLAAVTGALARMRPVDAPAPEANGTENSDGPAQRVASLVAVVRNKRDEVIRALRAIADETEWSRGSELIRDADMQACLARIEKRFREAQQSAVTLGASLERERAAAQELAIARSSIQRKLDASRGELEQLRGEHGALHGEREALRGKHETLRGEHDALRRQHDALRAGYAELQRFCTDRMAHAANAGVALAALSTSWRWRLGDRLVRIIEVLLMRGKAPSATAIVHDHLSHAVTELPAEPLAEILVEPVVTAGVATPSASVAPANAELAPQVATPVARDLAALREPSAEAAMQVLKLLQTEVYPNWERACGERAAAGQGKPAPRTQNPKVLIGTLYSGEQEYQACKEAIGRQSYRNLSQLCIENLPNREAHDRLYRAFLGGDSDLMIKIDADMVIVDETFIERVVELHLADPSAALIQMAILDFYSGGEIQGVNAYTRDMRWETAAQDGLFTDVTQTPRDRRKLLWSAFGRSVVHSPNPSPFQAFHFGVHRAVKAVVAATRGQNERAAEQLMYLERCHQHYQVRRDPRLALACIGAELALRGEFSEAQVDYTEGTLRGEFARYMAMTVVERERLLTELRERPVPNMVIGGLLSNRNSLLRRVSVQSLLLLLPHVQVFGGVNRFLEIARHARRQGIDAVIGVLRTSDAELQRFRLDFPDVPLLPLPDVFARRWNAVLCGDFSSCLMDLLPWVDADLSTVYLLNGWQHAHLNDVQIELAAPDVVFANSSYVARCYPRWAPTVVAGAVDTGIFFPPSATRQRNAGAILKVAVPCGRMKPRKRVQDAVLACEQAAANGVRIELHLFDAASIRIESSLPIVQHIGLSRNGVAELLRGMDVALCPEEDAGWNNPAAEAMACGVPLVCTIAGSLDFAVHDQTALVVEARDVAGFSDAICRLANDPGFAASLAERGLERIRAFTWPGLVRRLIDTMESARPDRERRSALNAAARKRVIATLGVQERP